MTHKSQNAATLREARNTVAEFERTACLTTKEMLMCEEGDPRLAKIDSFDLIDWHYALEQIAALDNILPILQSVAASPVTTRACGFIYPRTYSRELTNSTEDELLLVA